MPTTADILISRYLQSGRVCPYMAHWDKLWRLLPDRKQDSSGQWQPSLPLILGAWFTTSNVAKRNRFEEHLRWAETHGAIEQVADFLDNLTEEQWLTEPNTC